MYCWLPDVAEADLYQPLSVQVGCNNVTSNTVASAVSSWGQLAVTGVSGCATSTGNFTSGCRGGDTITVSGHGFGLYDNATQPLSVKLGTTSWYNTWCANVTLLSSTSLSCVLPPAFAIGQQLYVNVQIGYVQQVFSQRALLQ